MKKKKSSLNLFLVILIIVLLCAAAVLAVLLSLPSSDNRRNTEQQDIQTEADSYLLQEETEETESETAAGAETELSSDQEIETETETETETEEPETETEEFPEDEPIPGIVEKELASRETLGETWSVGVKTLEEEKENPFSCGYHADEKMQSASVIKVFIMGAVYDRMCYPSSPDRLISMQESYEGELRDLLEQMITVSDNNAANRLIELLGQGDFQAGARVVNQFCQENGFDSTSVGRRFLEENPSGENYTSAADCTEILYRIWNGTCVGEEASEKMLEILKQQTNTSKIPAGLPQGTQTANKTGEMPEGYNLGCIENDMAVVFSGDSGYILTVLSNNLGGRNSEAQQVIRNISGDVWEWYENR